MKLSTAAVVAFAIGVGACSGVDGRAAGPPQPDEETGQITEPIFQGTVGGGAGVVGLMFHAQQCTLNSCDTAICTGAIVARHMLITAAHCVTGAGWQQFSPTVFGGTGAVTYLDPRTATFKCLTRTSGDINGACQDNGGASTTDFVSMNGLIEPNFTGSLPSDARHDMGLLYMSANWPAGIDQTDAARIAYGTTRNGVNGAALRVGDSFVAFGNGDSGNATGLGTLRFAPNAVRVDVVNSGRISNKAGTVRMCYGDSGGPAWLPLPNVPIVFGVHSSLDNRANDFCATTGTYQHWASTETEIAFIRQTMQLLSVGCSNIGYVYNANIGISVLECW